MENCEIINENCELVTEEVVKTNKLTKIAPVAIGGGLLLLAAGFAWKKFIKPRIAAAKAAKEAENAETNGAEVAE